MLPGMNSPSVPPLPAFGKLRVEVCGAFGEQGTFSVLSHLCVVGLGVCATRELPTDALVHVDVQDAHAKNRSLEPGCQFRTLVDVVVAHHGAVQLPYNVGLQTRRRERCD